MRIAEAIGTVVLSRSLPSLRAAALKLAIPLSLDDLTGELTPNGEELVVFDELGAGLGSRFALSEGGEAAQPFLPELVPVDAYNGAILDHIDVKSIEELLSND